MKTFFWDTIYIGMCDAAHVGVCGIVSTVGSRDWEAASIKREVVSAIGSHIIAREGEECPHKEDHIEEKQQ